MASTARIDELKKKFDDNPRRYFAPLANEFRKAGDLDQAILICEEFLPQQPGHMSGHIVYGQALYEAGKMPESRAVFETALGLDPENLIALRHLGDIARDHGDHAAARNWYVRVLDADPRNEEIQALIATLDSEFVKAEPEAAVEAPVSLEAPAFEMGLDIEKEVAPFEKKILPAEEEVAPIDSSLADTAPLGVPVIPPPLHTPAPAASDDLLDGFSLHGFDTRPGSALEMHGHSAPAEGLESTEFMPPEEHIPAADLDASLDSGVPSFSAPAEPIESLSGLQGSGGISHVELDDSAPRGEQPGFAPLDVDDGLVLPPQGDPLAADVLQLPAGEPTLAVDEAAPVELPPATPAPFVTETMAELYLTQGFREQALSVYVQLLAANPNDARLTGLVALLTPSEAVEDTGPNVRDFFAQMAARRPNTRSAALAPPADDDFAPPEHVVAAESPPEEAPYSVVEAEAEAETEAAAVASIESQVEAPSDAVAPAMPTPGGSIDALFGNRPPGTSEDSAAAALAQAFRGDAVAPPVIAGRPAHAASGELSLDSVFRDGPARPPRTSQSFSFDQFFTGTGERSSGATPQRASIELAMPGETPAEHSADEIEQFNSWLQGLKKQ